MRGAISAVRSWFCVGRPIVINKLLSSTCTRLCAVQAFEFVTRVPNRWGLQQHAATSDAC
jgi:hypothetical protein